MVEFLHDEDMILTAEASSVNSQKKRFVHVFEKEKVDQLMKQCKDAIRIMKGKLNMKSHIDPAIQTGQRLSTVPGPFMLRLVASTLRGQDKPKAPQRFETVEEAAAFLKCTKLDFVSALVDGSEVTHDGCSWWCVEYEQQFYEQHRVEQTSEDRRILNDALLAQERWLAELEAGLKHNKSMSNKITENQNTNASALLSDPVFVRLPQEKRKVKYVITIDDLDRCTDGKAIKVLSALQLFFNEIAPPVEDAVEDVVTCCSYNVDEPYSKFTSMKDCCSWIADVFRRCFQCCTSDLEKLEANREDCLNEKLEDMLETGRFKIVERDDDEDLDNVNNKQKTTKSQMPKQKRNESRKSNASEKPPFLVFLMIDPRIVVQEVENHFGDSLQKAGINGYDFLDKIIQTPFCKSGSVVDCVFVEVGGPELGFGAW